MLQRILCAVASFLVLSGGSIAADPHILAQTALNTSQSSVLLRQDGGVLPSPARSVRLKSGRVVDDGTFFVELALNGFSRDVTLPEVILWHGLMDRFSKPTARLSAQLDQGKMLSILAGPNAGFDLPVQVQMNDQLQTVTARVSGYVVSGTAIGLKTLIPISLPLAEFGYSEIAPLARLHFDFVFEGSAPETPPLLFAKTEVVPKITPKSGLAKVLRPNLRPSKPPAPRVIIAAKPGKAPARKPAAKPAAKKELVKITHTFRDEPQTKRSKCRNESMRVARRNAIIDPTADRRPGGRVDRALRRLVLAFNPCRN